MAAEQTVFVAKQAFDFRPLVFVGYDNRFGRRNYFAVVARPRIVARIPGKRSVCRGHDGNADLFARGVARGDGIDLIYKVQEISLRMGVTVTSALVVVAFEADIHRLHQRPGYSRHYKKKNPVADPQV